MNENTNPSSRSRMKMQNPRHEHALRGVDLKAGMTVMLWDSEQRSICWMLDILSDPVYRDSHGEWYVETDDGRSVTVRSLTSMGITPSAKGNFCKLITTLQQYHS